MKRREFLGTGLGTAGVLALATKAEAGVKGPSAQPQPAAFGVAGKDYPKVGGNLANHNHSVLSRINTQNVGRLGGAWHVSLEGGDTTKNQQSSIVAVDGVLYVQTTQQNVFAVDGKTGAVRWKTNVGKRTTNMRGVAVAGDKVFTTSGDNFVYALDRETGRTLWKTPLLTPDEEGQNLVTARPGDDLFKGLSVATLAGAIVHWDGLLYVGMEGSTNGVRGRAYALDAATGRVVWRFWTVPGPGEFGHDTWEAGDAWKTGGAVPWIHPSIDPELGLVYWTFGNPYPRTDGSARPGNNLFANCIVALDAKTGKRRWHFQSVHHDIWDYDNVMSPPLVDIEVDGKRRKAVIYGSKVGHYFVLDRVTGEPIHPVEERPVQQEPRQKTSATQPFPKDGGALVHQAPDFANSTRPVPFYPAGGLFSVFWERPTSIFPGAAGGPDWAYPSFNPDTGWVTVGYAMISSTYTNVRDGGVNTSRPYGEYFAGGIVTFDPRSNKVVWRKESEWALAHGNNIVTTAGGLMLQGHPDGLLHAMDARDGRTLWTFQTGAGVHTSPITYEVDGEQYIAVLAGGQYYPYADSPKGDHLWAFKLGGQVAPAKAPRAPSKRRDILVAPVDGGAVGNRVVLGRQWDSKAAAPGPRENFVAEDAMAPQVLRVTAGSTVTFVNPADNKSAHGAVSFFDPDFDTGLLMPGQSSSHRLDKPGEYFFNDPVYPQNTGKIIVI